MRYFKGKRFKKEIIIVAALYYCRFSLSYLDVSEILNERGISVHPTTIMRWVHEYGTLIYRIWKNNTETKKKKSRNKRYNFLDKTVGFMNIKDIFYQKRGFGSQRINKFKNLR